MNELLLAIAAIAALCGPRVQMGSGMGSSTTVRTEVKQCQVEMLKCVQSKQGNMSTALAQCVGETK